MTAYDTHLLVYAHRRESPFHERARAVLTQTIEGAEPWALLWPCVHEFIGVVTNPRIYKTPTPIGVALGAVRAWATAPSTVMLSSAALPACVLKTLWSAKASSLTSAQRNRRSSC